MLAGATQSGAALPIGLRLVVLADDLTGAADTAASFASRSPATLMIEGGSDWPGEGSLALDTETRHADEGVARQRVASLAKRAVRIGSVLYKKVDSLGRGNIAAEVAAALEVLRSRTPHAIALLSPAFPYLGRTTARGLIHADGHPVMRNGRPLDLAQLLQHSGLASRTVPAPKTTEGLVGQIRAAVAQKLDVLVVDASTENDLRRILEAAASFEEQVLLVGSGGLAKHLGEALFGPVDRHHVPEPPGGARLFVVGSRANQARAQRAALVAAGVLPIPVMDIPCSDTLRAIRAHLGSGGDVVIFPDPGMPVAPEDATRVAELLATVAQPLLDAACTIVLTGGETAHAVLRRTGVAALRILGELEPGVVLSKVLAQDLYVVTKAGSFGDDQVLVRRLHPTIQRSAP
ncbi:hypothetical protein OO014_06055 [Intrasporangium calvum]|uniref:Four-carbon acid sugar kinase family protein n=1 Tax=Intrasporangium calvum TaxID=53358 RepID=A0ABT5GEW9_9MICO|nr:four-carbon acid sugar kinase family protein [Intrasporangium calvum]MDC5696815.1 hypothetical protein [Intrasporangium calvum]